MADATPQDSQGGLAGQRYLYAQPELLTPEDHGGLGLSPVEAPLAFAAEAQAVPLTMAEFRTAQRHFPIVFSGGPDPMPLAITGFENRNYFVDEAGRWTPGVYVPAYLRCHPFALATVKEDQFAVVLDRASPMVNDAPQLPFFEDGKLTEGMRKQIDFCRAYDAEVEQTRMLCKRLLELDMLATQSLSRELDGKQEDLARYGAIEPKRFGAIDAAALTELRDKGWLAAVFAHFFSMDNWNALIRRRDELKDG
jgi:hypothetical protein